MERKPAIITASVISATLLTASGVLAATSGVFDSPETEPEQIADVSVDPISSQPTAAAVEPEVITVTIDEPPPATAVVPASPPAPTMPAAPLAPTVTAPNSAIASTATFGDDDDDRDDDDRDDDDRDDEDRDDDDREDDDDRDDDDRDDDDRDDDDRDDDND